MTTPLFTAAELEQDRMMAESRMLDRYDIRVPTGMAFVGGVDVETSDLLFNTIGRVKSAGLVAQTADVGARTSVTVSRELHIPVGSPAVPTGAFAVPTYLDATSDQTLAGARLRLAGPAPGSQTTARRLQVEEVLT